MFLAIICNVGSSQDRVVPSKPGDRRYGSIVWVTVHICSQNPVKAGYGHNYWWWWRHHGYLSGISLGCQGPSKENIMDDQLGLLWASVRRRSSTVWRRKYGVKVGEAGLEGERGRIHFHHWLGHRSVFMRFSARHFAVCSVLPHVWRCAGSPP